ncbi:MAG TPA: PAC2 family protein [Gaiellaceae bacterium]|jgi:predicted ATP-grasp superfamily ATP-dependent carboligase|nr:PAC2 family protein [Gaiellaceae bacterium]
MAELVFDHRPVLDRPVLIAAFRGWNDGAQGASLAGGFLAKTWGAEQFASIDPEEFYDFQATRPMVSLVDGITRQIDWPENDFYHASPEGLGRSALLLLGVEPSMRWRRFSSLIVDLAREYDVEMVVTLGALLADVPHTRPSPVTGTAGDQQLVEQLGLQMSRYEGPTGIVGVLHDACNKASLPSVSLWAAVPHYVSLAPSPRAALALCQRLGDLLETTIDTAELEQAVDPYTERVTEAVSSDEETAEYVQELERRAEMIDETSLPSGDSLAAELTRFLREQDEQDGPPDVATDDQ